MKGLGKAAFIFGFVLFLISSPAISGPITKAISANPEAQKLIDKAWATENIDSSAALFKQCVDLMERANKLDPHNDTILAELARYYWSYGDNLPKKTKAEQKVLQGVYAQGLTYAEESIKVKETIAGKYWWCTNRASGLEFASIFAQAAAFPRLKVTSDWVNDRDPQYFYGAIGRLWSEVLTRAPRAAVKLVGWSVQDAVDQINDSIKVAPGYLDNYAYKARFYHNYFEDDKTALALLDYELKQDPNTVMPTEVTRNKVSQRQAREFWKIITGKDYPNR